MLHLESQISLLPSFPSQVPIEEIIPPDLLAESPRSVTLPPSIIPESEDSTPSPTSEASSGYISTSISTATLSEVYTLSWDLPPSGKADGFEAVPDDEDVKVTQSETYPFLVDRSEPRESLLVLDGMVAEERTDLPRSKPDDTPSDSNQSQQEPNHSPSVQSKEQGEPDSVADSDFLSQTKQKQVSPIDHIAVEQLDSLDPLTETLLQDDETKPTDISQTEDLKPETPLTEELQLAAVDETEAELSLQHDSQPSAEGRSEAFIPQPPQPEPVQMTLDPAQDPAPDLMPVVPKVLVSAPASSDDLHLVSSSEEQENSGVSNSSGTSIPTSSSATDEVQQETPASTSTKATAASDPSSVQASKPDVSVANPFKIQKVKSSDLKSFQRILSEEEEKLAQDNRASSPGAGQNLTVPMESLEIISDTDEGDDTAVVPEWLKEGEFVTVGTNKSGTVRYVGPTDFAKGTWVGVELEVPAGE